MSNMIVEEMEAANEPSMEGMRVMGKVSGKCSGLMEINNQVVMFLTYGYVGIKGYWD